ncbi:uncharacterized protein LOC142323829 [Lycorma delicatula]|uniref:uncharacterized protein LOC142323829 n=1 Tax=Lycorma delicatula TaxID=130591 RepID=UPI003F515FBB
MEEQVITAHISTIRNLRFSSGNLVKVLEEICLQEEFEKIIYSAVDNKSESANKVSDVCSRLKDIELNIIVKKDKIQNYLHKIDDYNNKIGLLSEEYCILNERKMEVFKKKAHLEIRYNYLLLHSRNTINRRDVEKHNDIRLRANTFKNVTGVKFDYTVKGKSVEGFVINRKRLKWFKFDFSTYSEEMLWKLIYKISGGNDWPRLKSIEDN